MDDVYRRREPSKSWYCDGFSIVKVRDIDDAPNRDVNHLDTETRSVLMSTEVVVHDVIGEAAAILALSAMACMNGVRMTAKIRQCNTASISKLQHFLSPPLVSRRCHIVVYMYSTRRSIHSNQQTKKESDL
jgi:hypothetical protein